MLPASDEFSRFINDVASKNATSMKYFTIVVRAVDTVIPFSLKRSLNLDLNLKSPYVNGNDDYWLHFRDFMIRELNQHISTGWYDPSNWNNSSGAYSSSNLTVSPDSWSHTGEHRTGFYFCPNDPSWTLSKVKELVAPIVEEFTSVELVAVRQTNVSPRQFRQKRKKPKEDIVDIFGAPISKGDIIAYSKIVGQSSATYLGVVKDWSKAYIQLHSGDRAMVNKSIVIRSFDNKSLAVDSLLPEAEKYIDLDYFD